MQDNTPQKAEFDSELARAQKLGFSPELARRYQADVGPLRSKMLVQRGLVGLVLYLAYLVIDWLITPDVFGLALLLRLGVIAPVALLVLNYVRRNPPRILREGLPAAVCVLGGAVNLTVMAASQSPLRDYHHFSFVLLMLFLSVVLPIRFRYALVTGLALLALDFAGVMIMANVQPGAIAVDIGIFGAAMALSLFAAYTNERSFDAAYLIGQDMAAQRRKLEEANRHDPMTGLANRRALDETVASLTRIPPPGGLAVIVADIDHFKSYNDSYGHPAGDVCLKRVAGLVAAELRSGTDIAVRYGGEEFLMLLPGTDLWTARAVAERMRATVESAAMPHAARPLSGVVTISLGVAAGPVGEAVTVEELIAAADSALYAAKNAGRNQVWPRPRNRADIVAIDSRKSDVA